jgi:nitrite reductase/ring-hydroxylating ferredoxin subunit
MPLLKLASLADLPPGAATEVRTGGEIYALCNVDGEVYALDGVCPHASGPLGEGQLVGHTLVCPWHAWEYDCRTGENDFGPDAKVATFPVRVEGGDILIEVP